MSRRSIGSVLVGTLLFALLITACYETDPLPAAPSVRSAATKQARPTSSRGRAEIVLREATSGQTSVSATVGDTLTVEAIIEAGGESITGASLFISLDDALELVPHDETHRGLSPFEQGGYIPGGVVFQNDTLGDMIGEPNANGLPDFQLRYFENVQSSPFGPIATATGSGVLARFRARVVANRLSSVRINEVSESGSVMGYFVADKPGTNVAFRQITTFQVLPNQINPRIAVPTVDGKTEIVVRLRRLGHPVTDAEITAARSISGRPLTYLEAAATDDQGSALIEISDGQSGYYTIRAHDADGALLGVWDSNPVNPGKRHTLTFDILP
jgi:hypothetical protein